MARGRGEAANSLQEGGHIARHSSHARTAMLHQDNASIWPSGSSSVRSRKQTAKSQLEKGEEQMPYAVPRVVANVVILPGSEQQYYQPIPGWEHLYPPIGDLPVAPPPPPEYRKISTPGDGHDEVSPTTPDRNDGDEAITCQTPQKTPKATSTKLPPSPPPKFRKRKRSSLRPVSHEKLKLESKPRGQPDDDDDERGRYSAPASKTAEMRAFSIGDTVRLQHFYAARLKELTMKPVRNIVTEWIKALEPDRMRKYGRYHRKYPPQMPPDSQPAWWPDNVLYNEPAHLNKHELTPLAVDIMLIHRRKDERAGKPRAGWIARLKTIAEYNVTQSPAEAISSAKSAEYCLFMKNRALQILTDMFDVAQSHEDYLAQYNLYEGSGAKDPKRSPQHSWSPAPKPPRKSKKRSFRSKLRPGDLSKQDESSDDLGDETEVDDTLCMSTANSSFQTVSPYDEDEDNKSDTIKADTESLTEVASPLDQSVFSPTSMHRHHHHQHATPVAPMVSPSATVYQSTPPAPQPSIHADPEVSGLVNNGQAFSSAPATNPMFDPSMTYLNMGETPNLGTGTGQGHATTQLPQVVTSYINYGLQPVEDAANSFAPPLQLSYNTDPHQDGWWVPPQNQHLAFGNPYCQSQLPTQQAYSIEPNSNFANYATVSSLKYVHPGTLDMSEVPRNDQNTMHGLPQ
ncbi:hypothetical protein BS50DRAFT_270122 [Corynespora cassiicola Philippines]|uniref:Subtelomeric hrmA-associated cluster protein AFUB-079030/YDR124W-like helical bundle domain-containing protein n=1 Tax=Corynespora cassiicola Philippines TaxID=1448308 RepID=A0A2T2NZT5_CORCC|nr:hypothetical protein BS50DRAFT_270122 [Corynespora cassiicola Philippines]